MFRKIFALTFSYCFLFMMFGIVVSCDNNSHKDDSFVSIIEVDERGEKDYTSNELLIYPDSIAVLNTQDGRLSVYNVTALSSDHYSLEGVAKYKDDRDYSIIEGVIPSDLTVDFNKETHTWEIQGKGMDFRMLKFSKNPYRKYYNKGHVLHDYLAQQMQTTHEKENNMTKSDSEYESDNSTVPEVPIKPDYSNGRLEGELNDFTPQNYNQFVQYYLGIILGTMCLVGFIILFFGKAGYSEYDFRYTQRYTGFFYTCLVFATIVTVVELQAFLHNPLVLFQSDFPLFGCLGRVLCFCILSIITTNISRHLRVAIEDHDGLDSFRGGWLITLVGIGTAVWGVVRLMNISASSEEAKKVMVLCGSVFIALGLIQMLRVSIKGNGFSLVMLVYYLLIYPWGFVQSVFGGVLALLGKIAREKPDNEYVKNEDPDHRYVTDALGNGTFITRLSGDNWIDSTGNMFSGSGKSYTRLGDGRKFF